jgi:hypothetical protein
MQKTHPSVDNLAVRIVSRFMRLVAAAVCATSLFCATGVALSQQPQKDADPLELAARADGPTPRSKDEHPRVPNSFEYTPSHQDRVVAELVRRIELHNSIQREAELKTLHESPLTTVLDLTRFLTSRGYKRADGSPLIDLTF